VAATTLCATALVLGAALLAHEGARAGVRGIGRSMGGGGGGVELLQERLSIGLNIAKAFEQVSCVL